MRLKFAVTFLFAFWTKIDARSTGSDANGNIIDKDTATVEVKRGADASAKSLKEYLDGCKAGYRLQDEKKVEFSSPSHAHPPGLSCAWTFVGDKTCTPEIVCPTLELNESEDCSEHYLEISDGVGGVEKFCGKAPITTPIRASHGQSDLYVKYHTASKDQEHKGFKCEARCSTGGSPTELKQTEDGKKEEFRCVCGLQNKDDRIVGGEDAKMNEFPWQVAIVTAGTRAPICGGSIINSRYVLTAAHCFYFTQTKIDQIEVLFHARLLDMTLLNGWKSDVALGEAGSIKASGWNETQKTDAQEKTQRFKVLEIIGHPLFTDSYDYDVALLKLDRKIELVHPDAPTPICLPPIGTTDDYENTSPWVVGWGLGNQNAGGTTRALQKLSVPVLNTDKCQSWTQNKITDRMLCAGFEDGVKDACTGDSGGPLSLKQANNQWVQVGIVSWGEGCAQAHKPGMYSRVTALQQYIEYHSEGATWCRTTKG